MVQYFYKLVLKLSCCKIYPRYIQISNWDFIVGVLARVALGYKVNYFLWVNIQNNLFLITHQLQCLFSNGQCYFNIIKHLYTFSDIRKNSFSECFFWWKVVAVTLCNGIYNHFCTLLLNLQLTILMTTGFLFLVDRFSIFN